MPKASLSRLALAFPHALSIAKPSTRRARSSPSPAISSDSEAPNPTADQIKATALSAAKGLNRSQAECAATAAARNKEEGPSHWQERKEAKRQMYLMSTEKAAILGVKPKVSATSSLAAHTQCQKCFQPGHWTYETQQLKNPKLKKPALPVPYHFENPDMEKREEGGEEADERNFEGKI
uniref:Uncharacterized protein n=1 Tax=Oryza punctata TaxID=4537 RepID=A0A0E0LNX9_ORYPU